MEFELSDEHKMLRESVRSFAEKELEKRAWEIDRTREFPKDNYKKCAELNLTGVAVPEVYGGGGMDNISYAIATEEISRVCASTGVILSVNNSLACDPILNYGTEEQKKKYLVPLASGKSLGCFCLSEPEAGTDAANQKTVAQKDGDFYILNGTKNFITNGVAADIAIVFAKTGKTGTHKDISVFIVEAGTKGYKIGKEERKLGITASGSTEIVVEDCKVPAENLLGKEGDGFKIAMGTLDGGRIGIAAQALGIAQRALEESVKYSKVRKTFDKPIAEYQAIQWKIADMATAVEAARLLTYRAAWSKDRYVATKGKERYTKQAAIAKLFASECAMKAAVEAIQIHGGYGYIADYIPERLFRDAKITEIYEGTSEVQRMVIASWLLKEIA